MGADQIRRERSGLYRSFERGVNGSACGTWRGGREAMTKGLASTRVFWILGLPVVIALIVLTIFGSRILINPSKIDITPCGDVVMFRSYPAADLIGVNYPLVKYVTTVTPLTPETNDGYVCREDNGEGQRYNHDHQRGFGKWRMNHYAEPCMKDPVGFVINVKYTALLFDLIPLRPINVTSTVITRNDGWQLCPFRNPQ